MVAQATSITWEVGKTLNLHFVLDVEVVLLFLYLKRIDWDEYTSTQQALPLSKVDCMQGDVSREWLRFKLSCKV